MLKVALLAVLVIAGTLTTVLARPGFVPANAYWRIDRHDATPASSKGNWMDIGEYPGENGAWGQGKCVGGGTECHLNDFCTWWEILVSPPSPPAGYTPVEFGSVGFPMGYDTVSGEYYY